jgi:hypothetical protein
MNTIEQSPTGQGYKSLAELRMRKKILLNDIQKDDEQIKELWDNLFHKRSSSIASTPTRRFSGLINTGAGILDGIILGWKLYRKFKK